jgi:hypothetical protein
MLGTQWRTALSVDNRSEESIGGLLFSPNTVEEAFMGFADRLRSALRRE